MLASEEFTFLRAHTTRIAKVTLPSPTLFANLWDPDRSRAAYPRFDDFMADVVALLVDEVRELERLGAAYVQLDAPHYPLLIDPQWRRFYEDRGWTLERWLSYGIELDNAIVDAAPRITFGFHLCRGNQDSRWLVSGAYDAIAAPIFGAISGAASAARVRRRALRQLRGAGARPGGQARGARPRHDEDRSHGERRGARAPDRCRRRASSTASGSRWARSAASRRPSSATASRVDDERRKLELIAATGARIWPPR